MEAVVVVLSAMLAGAGTGLAGLSAATAMVPLLIVLCLTFATLVWVSQLSVWNAAAAAAIIAPVAALVELNTKHGLDTVAVPIAASLILELALL